MCCGGRKTSGPLSLEDARWTGLLGVVFSTSRSGEQWPCTLRLQSDIGPCGRLQIWACEEAGRRPLLHWMHLVLLLLVSLTVFDRILS